LPIAPPNTREFTYSGSAHKINKKKTNRGGGRGGFTGIFALGYIPKPHPPFSIQRGGGRGEGDFANLRNFMCDRGRRGVAKGKRGEFGGPPNPAQSGLIFRRKTDRDTGLAAPPRMGDQRELPGSVYCFWQPSTAGGQPGHIKSVGNTPPSSIENNAKHV